MDSKCLTSSSSCDTGHVKNTRRSLRTTPTTLDSATTTNKKQTLINLNKKESKKRQTVQIRKQKAKSKIRHG